MNKTQQRVLKVLENIRDQVAEDPDVADGYSEGLDEMLNELSYQDFFGTEGQTDPRGDQREHAWNMKRVQGIDR